MDRNKLRRCYGRLRGIKDLVSTQDHVRKDVGDDYNSLVTEISAICNEDLKSFLLPSDFFFQSNSTLHHKIMCRSATIRDKLLQFLSYLEYGYSLNEQVIEIGSIYNSIADEELKGRCADILSAPGNFDRVINQATLVLEERIRAKSKLTSEIGVQLVNKAINADISKSVLKLSDDANEHEGFGHICRGIVLSFRNPTHHRIVQSYTREDALKFCAFVDSLLKVIDAAK